MLQNRPQDAEEEPEPSAEPTQDQPSTAPPETTPETTPGNSALPKTNAISPSTLSEERIRTLEENITVEQAGEQALASLKKIAATESYSYGEPRNELYKICPELNALQAVRPDCTKEIVETSLEILTPGNLTHSDVWDLVGLLKKISPGISSEHKTALEDFALATIYTDILEGKPLKDFDIRRQGRKAGIIELGFSLLDRFCSEKGEQTLSKHYRKIRDSHRRDYREEANYLRDRIIKTLNVNHPSAVIQLLKGDLDSSEETTRLNALLKLDQYCPQIADIEIPKAILTEPKYKSRFNLIASTLPKGETLAKLVLDLNTQASKSNVERRKNPISWAKSVWHGLKHPWEGYHYKQTRSTAVLCLKKIALQNSDAKTLVAQVSGDTLREIAEDTKNSKNLRSDAIQALKTLDLPLPLRVDF